MAPDGLQNRFLDTLPAHEARQLLSSAVHVELPLGSMLFRSGSRPDHVYLLTSGMASVLYSSEEGQSIELSTFGSDGPIGWLFLFGSLPSVADCTMQVGGAGYRMPFQRLQDCFNTSPIIRRRVLEMAQQKALTAYQNVACNRLHPTSRRLARWLLTTGDMVRSDSFSMTQAFLASMLGTRRATVTLEARQILELGLIRYRRGQVHLLDRAGLMKRSCPCYGILRDQMDRIYSKA